MGCECPAASPRVLCLPGKWEPRAHSRRGTRQPWLPILPKLELLPAWLLTHMHACYLAWRRAQVPDGATTAALSESGERAQNRGPAEFLQGSGLGFYAEGSRLSPRSLLALA